MRLNRFRSSVKAGLICLGIMAFATVSMTLAQIEKHPSTDTTVVFRNGNKVFVPGPFLEQKPDVIDYGFYWEPPEVVISPNGRFAALKYYMSEIKYYDTFIYLANDGGKITKLKNSKVKSIEWTRDGQYIIGIGENTLRIWSLDGKLRALSFGNINSYVYYGDKVCVNIINYADHNGKAQDDYLTNTYSIPALKLLGSAPSFSCASKP